MDFFKAVLEVVKFLWDPLARQISYVKNLNKNVEDLRKNMDELTCKENDVTNEIERAKLQRRVPREEVNNWLKDVENVKNEVTVIEKEFAEQERCGNGCVPDCYTARKLSKRALEKASKVHELKQKGLFEGGVAVDQLPATIHTLPTTSLEGKTSAEKTLEQILDYIMDAKIGMIGIYGMGGVGKTTIMMNINNRLKDAKHFNSIIWVTVSQDFNLKRLQTDIAKKVELDLQEADDEVSRASTLYEALMKRRKFLLILDDMWKAFSLEKVGIPKPSKENGCKIALTTRSWDVCGGMKTDKVIKVQVLSEEEAWVLFKDNIGSDMVLASDVQEIAELVAKECGGLPLALITVGGALREVKDVHEWRDALNQLRSSVTEIEGMQDEVFGRLKFSYNRLSNEKSRACFLYCSLYPEDYKIPVEEVIRYWICEGLIDEVGDIQAKIDNGHSIVNKLVRACMLESFIDRVRYVKMHDLIRDMAIGITKHNPLFMVKAGIGMEEPPNDDEWLTEVERVSLMRNRIHSLLATPNCCKLTTLFLQGNPLQGHITSSLFQHMCGLRVLDLSDSHIQCLPDSLSDLVNLRALVLTECKYLSTVPSLAKLKELRLLDLSSTEIEVLPHGMEGLAKLRFLDLSGMCKLKTIEAGVISKLLFLEQFMALGDDFIQAFKPQERKVSDEIASLSRLVHLKLSFPNLVTFSHYVESEQWRKLKKFSFVVGAKDPMYSRQLSYIKEDEINYLYELERVVYLDNLQLGTRKSPLLLPANIVELAIDECTNFSRLSLLSLPNVEGLKLCYINECHRVKSILSVEDNASFLTSLEHLVLEELSKLQTICQGVATLGTFQSLKTIIIVECHRLKNLFSVGWLKNLQKLETIFVKECDGMEELVAEEEEDEISATNGINNDIIITLPMLKNIYLSDVYKLKKICGKVLMCSSMAFIKIKGCLKLHKIPFSVGTSSVTFKGEIEGTGKWWDELEWDDAAIKPLLLPLYKKLEDDDTDDSDDDNDSDHDDDDEEEEEEEEEEDDDDDDDDVHHYHHHHEKEASEKEETAITTTK
ncbi:disease resistance protein At4g27190-like [Magnolia sinica]|uniref:disease resistance protein At4g27190-like n=1 Tax=Magnolia sinica TaxID=86752 RepID=UPI00265A3299|nr:disease resistance protein At4g27190-like [Magnolia sinica]XP_058087035.1 disease resistance protein At4g27190-like [Magnolia sinica]XP_058087094.1 disease resistance protein At4g27190-like [Magnolia sinica]